LNLPEFSVKRPTTVIMTAIAMIILGLVSLVRLPVELYPNTSFGEISIVIYVRGELPPVEVEAMVTRPVEEAVATVANLKQMISTTKEGESTVVLSFEPGTDMDFAALEVREKFAKVKNKLPKEIEKPVIAKYKQSDVPAVIFALTSSVRSPEDIRKIVDERIKERFKRVKGVANVEVAGGRERKILVEIDQQKMVAYGLAMDELTGTLGANNLNLLSGEVDRTDEQLLVRMIGEFDSIDQIKGISLKRTEYGSVIRLGDVATVKDGYLDAKEYSRLNVKDTVSVYIQKESSANTISVVKNIEEEIERVKLDLPADIRLVVTSNQATFIQKAIDGLNMSLMQGTILIVLVLFLFLFAKTPVRAAVVVVLIVLAMIPNIWSLGAIALLLTVIVIVKPSVRPVLLVISPIPISVVSTFFLMRIAGLTVNVMTLFGLALGSGMLVDNAIVVFDNVLKKFEHGVDRSRAAAEGASELMMAIVASSLTTIIVFLPMIFMSKEIQLLYSSMAITVIFSIVISLVCALSIVPLLASKRMFNTPMRDMVVSRDKEWLDSIYPKERKLLFRTVRNVKTIIICAVIYLGVSGFLFSRLPADYLGNTEQNKFTVFIEMPTGVKLDVSNEAVKKVEAVVREVPEVKTITSRIEAWSSKVYVELVPSTERKRSNSQVIEEIRSKTGRMDPAFVYFEEDNQVGTKEITIEVYGYDYKTLRQLAIGISNRMESVAGLTDLKIRMREGRPEMTVVVDKSRAAALGVSTQSVADQIHGAMRGLRATLYHEQGKEIETITRLEEKYRKTFRDLYKLIISTQDGTPILLEQVANFKFDLGPSEVWRKNKDRMIQVSANLNKVPLSKAVERVKEKLSDLEFPENYHYEIGGDYETLVKSQKEMRMVILMVIILVYLVLASLFESFTQPFIIMVAVPLALGGAVLALYLGPKTIGIGALLGLMMLAGIVVNHSIILVDRVNYYHRDLKIKLIKSVMLANKDRLRPILLTTSTTILGLVPMAIDKSDGANLWSPLALTVIGGLFSSLILTLLITPSIYLAFSRISASAVSNNLFIVGLNKLRYFWLSKAKNCKK
jgi:HAE1 family hydrophobic/amphiphilic exporter-1